MLTGPPGGTHGTGPVTTGLVVLTYQRPSACVSTLLSVSSTLVSIWPKSLCFLMLQTWPPSLALWVIGLSGSTPTRIPFMSHFLGHDPLLISPEYMYLVRACFVLFCPLPLSVSPGFLVVYPLFVSQLFPLGSYTFLLILGLHLFLVILQLPLLLFFFPLHFVSLLFISYLCPQTPWLFLPSPIVHWEMAS